MYRCKYVCETKMLNNLHFCMLAFAVLCIWVTGTEDQDIFKLTHEFFYAGRAVGIPMVVRHVISQICEYSVVVEVADTHVPEKYNWYSIRLPQRL